MKRFSIPSKFIASASSATQHICVLSQNRRTVFHTFETKKGVLFDHIKPQAKSTPCVCVNCETCKEHTPDTSEPQFRHSVSTCKEGEGKEFGFSKEREADDRKLKKNLTFPALRGNLAAIPGCILSWATRRPILYWCTLRTYQYQCLRLIVIPARRYSGICQR